ncbi:hypothetical protein SAMN04489832_1838 [Micromonospora cremea]|uniref:Uncharacterized protein n=1 Tax=Micromonospora cremea TaxID=709881 RepID=A0A1N5VSA4_9ACTN|nr:hypothetical protein SAMN04489832_1838 [Micromonospora cremea]
MASGVGVFPVLHRDGEPHRREPSGSGVSISPGPCSAGPTGGGRPDRRAPGLAGQRTAATAASGPPRHTVPASLKPAAVSVARCQETGGFHSGLCPVG